MAKVAFDEALGASEAEVILHADSGDAGGAVGRALDGVPLANVEMRLQEFELVSPSAAFFRMDAVDFEAAYLGVGRHIRIHLKRGKNCN